MPCPSCGFRDAGAEMVSLVQNGHINVSMSASSVDEIEDEDTRNLLTSARSDSAATDPASSDPVPVAPEAEAQYSTPVKTDTGRSPQSVTNSAGDKSPRPRIKSPLSS